jgi:hypothetical protein
MCQSLTELQIPDKVTKICGNAFAMCRSLTVYYEGSREEWLKIYPKDDVNTVCAE